MKVELISVLGTDLTVANAARVSFNVESDTLTDKDKKLITYLAKHEHYPLYPLCSNTTGNGSALCGTPAVQAHGRL